MRLISFNLETKRRERERERERERDPEFDQSGRKLVARHSGGWLRNAIYVGGGSLATALLRAGTAVPNHLMQLGHPQTASGYQLRACYSLVKPQSSSKDLLVMQQR